MAIVEPTYDYSTFMTSTSQVIVRNPLHTAGINYSNTFEEHLNGQLKALTRERNLNRIRKSVVLKRSREER